MADGGRRLSYRQLDGRSNRLARLLDRLAVPRTGTVGVLLENGPEWAEVLWAAHRSGRWVAPVNWHLKAGEITHVLRAGQVDALVTSVALHDLAAAAVAPLPHVRLLLLDAEQGAVDAGDAVACASAMADLSDRPVLGEVAGGRVMFSSGTTGTPKAVRHRGPGCHPSQAPPHLGPYTELFEFGPRTVYLSPAPTYHTAPFRFLHAVTQLGGTVVMLERFDPELALRAIERHRVTHAQFVPTMLLRMLRLPERVRRAYDLSSLEVAITGAASCPPAVKDDIDAWWGPVLHELYGASEGYGNCHIGPLEARTRPGSVGRALSGTLHITDEEGSELPVGQVGRVWFEGNVGFEYSGAREATSMTRHPSGWTTVGDLGRLDEDGYLYLHGRHDHVIISGGVNVHPQEVEDVLAVHPAVEDVAVIGLDDEDLGQAVHALVVARQKAPDDLSAVLLTHCRTRLAHYKCPRSIRVVDELPRAENGKLYKGRLPAG